MTKRKNDEPPRIKTPIAEASKEQPLKAFLSWFYLSSTLQRAGEEFKSSPAGKNGSA
ncbi:MAG TPA: hypothetical protein PK547_02115 [Candidatus Paceibacterota bacterium]|nr:hypothetical protein [Candidatus Paceibacterota bacterium]